MIKPPTMPRFEVVVTTLPSSGYPVRLSAGEAERAAVALATDVDAFERLSAEVTLRRWRRDGVHVAGHVDAVAIQPCVVTLEPVRQVIDDEFSSTFVPAGSKLARRLLAGEGEMILDPEGEDAPEVLEGDAIDVWSVVAEWLNLAVDRFPRAPDAKLELQSPAEAAEGDRVMPFAQLAKLKRGEG